MCWKQAVLKIIKSSKSSRTKPLLIILYTAAVNAAILFFQLPRVCEPEFRVANRNNVHVSHYPNALRIILSWNCYNKAGSYSCTYTAVWSFKTLYAAALICKAIFPQPGFKGPTLFFFAVSTTLWCNGRYRG